MLVHRGLRSLVKEPLDLVEDVLDVVFQLRVREVKLLASVSSDGDKLMVSEVLGTKLNANRNSLRWRRRGRGKREEGRSWRN